ncbi:probable cationic amino acid transporter [Limulus polyphemus]|uniref:Probable cationic amino acid transporter n=1 Tax=Limulus polyphemus TaxID=6850 RepID=A0ABM1T1F8_LIMPO|nr:probable cationic amino acid transporter [Limulus polyphemus]
MAMFTSKSDRIKAKLLILVGKLIRTKDPSSDLLDSGVDNKLKKCLTTFDLISLGVGSCVGTGMYLVSGMVARNVAGPGVVLSFLIAAVASLFSGVCYAEFGVRVPHTTGSAYMYSYVTVGEFIAFVIGWNMILEYLIGTAAGACAISACVDAMCGGAINDVIRNSLGTIIGHTPDILAAFVTVLMTVLLVAGVKKSLLFNNILNTLNLSVWIFVMGAGLFYVDINNWTSHGGFLPYGWSGVLSGAATCFYAFIGFDIIATTGEEAENPQRSIPRAVIASLVIVLTAYITSSMIMTLVVPYDQIIAESALVEVFGQVGAPKSKFIVAFGALAGLIVSMFGSMFPMPRVVYAMAKDGLIIRSLSQVWPYTGTPAIATCVFGAATAFVAIVMSLDVLVEMMSIGTLMAYTLVSTCVLILRYQPHNTTLVELLPESIRSACPTPCKEIATPIVDLRTMIHSKRSNRTNSSDSEDSQIDKTQNLDKPEDLDFLVSNGSAENYSYGAVHRESFLRSRISDLFQKIFHKIMTRLFPYEWIVPKPPTEASGQFVMKIVGLLYLLIIIFDLIIVCAMPALENNDTTTLMFLFLCLVGIVLCLIVISLQPQTKYELKFKAPGVPIVPAVAIIVNIYLIFKLSVLTLIRFTVWMTVGLLMYFLYGIKKSSLECLPQPAMEMKIPQSRREKALKYSQENDETERSAGNSTTLSQKYLSLPTDGANSLINLNYQPSERDQIVNPVRNSWDTFE